MTKDKFVSVVSGLFLIIGIIHVLRLLNGWEVQIASATIPMWASWAGVLVAFYLAFTGFRLVKN